MPPQYLEEQIVDTDPIHEKEKNQPAMDQQLGRSQITNPSYIKDNIHHANAEINEVGNISSSTTLPQLGHDEIEQSYSATKN